MPETTLFQYCRLVEEEQGNGPHCGYKFLMVLLESN